MSPTYDMLLPDECDIPQYRGRIPPEGRLHAGVEARNRITALKNILGQYGCSELFNDVIRAINEGKGQLEKRPSGAHPVFDYDAAFGIGNVRRIRYETEEGKTVITQRKRPSLNKYKNQYEISVTLADSSLRQGPYKSFGFSINQAIASLCHSEIHDNVDASIEARRLVDLYNLGSNSIRVRLLRRGKKKSGKLKKSEPRQLALPI